MQSSAALKIDFHEATELWLSNPVLAAAGEAECAWLARRFPVEAVTINAPMALAGEAVAEVLVLHEGVLRVFHRSPDGREALVALVRGPALLGHVEALSDRGWVANVAALEDSRFSRLPTDAFQELLLTHPAVGLACMRDVSIMACVATYNQRQVFAMLDQRIANLLLTLAELQGDQASSSNRPTRGCASPPQPVITGLSMPMIAKALGTLRRSAAKVVAELTRRKLIRRRRNGDFVLLEPAMLAELARPIRGGFLATVDGPGVHPEHPPARAELEVLDGSPLAGTRVPLDRELLVGSHSMCHIQIEHRNASPKQCRFYRASTGTRYWVENVGPEGDTLLDGRPLVRAVLRGNEIIEVGGVRLAFRVNVAPRA